MKIGMRDSNIKGYNANPNLKAANVAIQFTTEQAEEYVRCATDPIYFIEKYVKIVTIDKGLTPFILHDYQKEMILAFKEDRKVIVRAARQIGKTTTVAAFFTWYIIFNDAKTAAILANKAATAREILSRVQLAYEHVPHWMKQGVVTWNKGDIELENGSRIIASATSSSAIRGYTINLLFLDEFAFVPGNIAEEFFTSVYPTISSGTTSKILIASTPNGMNHFFKMWTEAEEGINQFSHIFVHWSRVPGRDEKWADDQRKVLGKTKFAQEMDCDFIGSSNTLINAAVLKSIPFRQPEMSNGTLSVYKKPETDAKYVITVDVARGAGLDYSAFIVVDITKSPYEIVAKYKNNSITSMSYPTVIHKIALEYNNAWVLVENNDAGQQVADILHHDYEYENTLMSNKDVVSIWGAKTLGLRTTTKTKAIGCDIAKSLIESNKLVINDYDILFELSNFVSKGRSFAAADGYNDDLSMCLVNFGYLTSQPVFKEFSDDDLREQMIREKEQMVEEELTPFGFYDDGQEEEGKSYVNF
jgi:hypothetical protein